MVNVYFAPNRKPNNRANPTDFGKEFSADGLSDLRYGVAEVTGEKLDRYELNVFQQILEPDSSGRALDPEKSTLGSQALMRSLRQKMKAHERDTVVFIHGFNVKFKEALKAAAQLKINFKEFRRGRAVNVVLFSWPSDGSAMPYIAYKNDRQDARASATAFARSFLKLSAFLKALDPNEECRQKLHLVAHSMGNYVLRNALQEILAMDTGRPPRVFDQVFLMAADEDDDAFEHHHKLLPLPWIAQRVNLYFNNADLAMDVSDMTKGNPDRLGADGPRLPSQVPAKVSLVDCPPVVHGAVEHSYYVETERVIDDMRQVLAGFPPDQVRGRLYIPDSNRYRIVP